MHTKMGKAHKVRKVDIAHETQSEAYRKHLLLQEEMKQALKKQEMQELDEMQKLYVVSQKKLEEKKLKKQLKKLQKRKKQHMMLKWPPLK